MEAALADRGVDYRDRWRVDPATGRPLLTLRRVAVLVLRFMPETSPVAEVVAGFRPVSRLEALVDDTRRAVLAAAGVKNPDMHPDRDRALKQARAAEHRRRAPERDAEHERRKALFEQRKVKRRAQLAALEQGEV